MSGIAPWSLSWCSLGWQRHRPASCPALPSIPPYVQRSDQQTLKLERKHSEVSSEIKGRSSLHPSTFSRGQDRDDVKDRAHAVAQGYEAGRKPDLISLSDSIWKQTFFDRDLTHQAVLNVNENCKQVWIAVARVKRTVRVLLDILQANPFHAVMILILCVCVWKVRTLISFFLPVGWMGWENGRGKTWWLQTFDWNPGDPSSQLTDYTLNFLRTLRAHTHTRANERTSIILPYSALRFKDTQKGKCKVLMPRTSRTSCWSIVPHPPSFYFILFPPFGREVVIQFLPAA